MRVRSPCRIHVHHSPPQWSLTQVAGKGRRKLRPTPVADRPAIAALRTRAFHSQSSSHHLKTDPLFIPILGATILPDHYCRERRRSRIRLQRLRLHPSSMRIQFETRGSFTYLSTPLDRFPPLVFLWSRKDFLLEGNKRKINHCPVKTQIEYSWRIVRKHFLVFFFNFFLFLMGTIYRSSPPTNFLEMVS